MLFLSRSDVEAALDFDELVEALATAMGDLSAGKASMPPRGAATIPERQSMLAAMPAFLPSSGALVTKLVSLFPHNTDRPTHQALICVFDPANGTPLALMDGTYITAVRTAAGSALATKLLARSDRRIACIVGTGVQARTHAQAMAGLGLRPKIAGRDQGRLEALVHELIADGVDAEAAPSIEEAVGAADVVCLATHAGEPVIRREWLRPGTHINSVGYNTSGEGEVDLDTIRDSLVVVESRAATLAPPPAGAVELRRAVDFGVITPDRLPTEIGEIINGTAPRRTDAEQITLYKSVGVAVQDAAAAALVLAKAKASNIGRELDL